MVASYSNVEMLDISGNEEGFSGLELGLQFQVMALTALVSLDTLVALLRNLQLKQSSLWHAYPSTHAHAPGTLSPLTLSSS